MKQRVPAAPGCRRVPAWILAATLLTGACLAGRANTDDSPMTASHSHTNRLAHEKSPYLLQHQYNPVDWYPWGEEAFARARSENKPIFLSIGYSTCHWCHVMERESFEDATVAAFLNSHFISIKVDREERPDVDKIYMTAVQAMTGQGGWPLNLFITPDLKPFYGGTYFPPESRFGRPSFLDLLKQIDHHWQTNKDHLEASAKDFHQKLEKFVAQEPSTKPLLLNSNILHHAMKAMKENYEPHYGGFGRAPKFPRPSVPLFLLRAARRFHDHESIEMVLHTCDRMAAGGMHDQLGGGFARYSTDEMWLVPHFEKMLYDNAQLLNLYLDVYIVGRRTQDATVARDIISYVLRDMTHPEGGFYSAEDADSEGKEGKFYCWTREEIAELLTPAEFHLAEKYYGLTAKGNFVDHSDPHPLPNQNVLSIVDEKISADDPLIVSAKAKLFAARSHRVRPHLDDKILCSWNGLMLGALARASVVLKDESYRHAAEKNLAFLQTHLWDASTHTLYLRWRDGARDNVQILDAYSGLLSGVLDLYEATTEARHLAFANELADAMIKRFYDSEHGGFYQGVPSPDLILRAKEDYDGAEPSANSVAIGSLLRLSAITGRKDFRDVADKSLRLFAPRLKELPEAVPNFLSALDFSLEEPHRAVVVGPASNPATQALLTAIHSVYQPNKVVLGKSGPVEEFARALPDSADPTAYICTGTMCQPPTREPAAIWKYLE